jgi:inorganic phosphate transporter, PiT family
VAATIESSIPVKGGIDQKLSKSPSVGGIIIFGLILAAGMFYAASHLISDLSVEKATTIRPFIMLGGALLIALGFEFVNGFHDTANAVATVIYTHSLEPHIAVAWSGLFNFAGVLLSSGAVAFGILSLLPVELIMQVGSSGGFAMVFALLVAAMIWNLGTWYLGLPASSSHTSIAAADYYGLPVSTTHVLSSGVAGTMMANKSGLQLETVRNIAMAWVLTLPASIMLAAFLFWLFRHLF